MSELVKRLQKIDKKLAELIAQHSIVIEEAYAKEKKKNKAADFHDFITSYKHKRVTQNLPEEEKHLMDLPVPPFVIAILKPWSTERFAGVLEISRDDDEDITL